MSFRRWVVEKRAALGFRRRSISSFSGGRITRQPMMLLPEDYKLHSVGGGGGGSNLNVNLNLEKKRSGADDDLEIVGSAQGWIALHNRRNDAVLLSNPLTGQQDVKLPPLHTLPEPLGGGGVSRVALSDDGRRAAIVAGRARRLAFCDPGRSTEWTKVGDDLFCDLYRRGYGAVPQPREYEDVVYSSRHRRFYCVTRLGIELEGWSLENPRIEWRWRIPDDDYYENNWIKWSTMALDNHDYDYDSSFIIRRKRNYWHLKYLVFAEEREQLFLVVRHVDPRYGMMLSEELDEEPPVYYSKYRGGEYCYPYKTDSFDVYKIHMDGDGGRVEYVEDSLDGLAMVVGMNQSIAYEAEAAALHPNSVYFSDERRLMLLSWSEVHNAYGGHDNGIFDYKSKSFSPCGCCSDHPDCPLALAMDPLQNHRHYYRTMKRIDPPPLWLTPDLGVSISCSSH